MQHSETVVIGGVDAHTDAHHAAALDQRGALLGTASFATTTRGYGELLDWLAGFGAVDAVAVESTGAYAAGLTRHLRQCDIRVVEVNQPHAHTRRRRGKSDPLDAEMAARLVLAGQATATPKRTDGIVESIRLLRVARHSAVKARSAAMVQLSELIVTAPQELREQLAQRKTARGKAALCRRLRPSPDRIAPPLQAAKLALRSLARRIAELDTEIAALDRQLEPLVATAAPRTPACSGSPPATPASCWSPPARTSTASAVMALSPRSAASARSRPPPDARPATASTTAATAKPTGRCT